jgi:glycosyltransferase involved in cell wall biosynthesis
MPVYNGVNFVRQAVDSVLAQTLQDFELVVVDDGSTDQTPALLAQYGARLRYFRQENRGVAAAVNHGIRQSRGRYISWLSHDDMYAPEKLERQVAALQALSSPGACYTDVAFIDKSDKITWTWALPEYPQVGDAARQVLIQGVIGLAAYSLFYDRACLETVGMYNERLPHTQDADFLLRLTLTYPLVRVPATLIRVREHPDRGVRKHKAAWEKESYRFYRGWSLRLGVEQLFPTLRPLRTRKSRAAARILLGDDFAKLEMPFARLALIQYGLAVWEWPPIVRYAWPLMRTVVRRSTPPTLCPTGKESRVDLGGES